MKLIIAGSRSFRDYSLMEKEVRAFIKNEKDITIISGRARGADLLGELFAERNGYRLMKMPANWEGYGKGAGHLRNLEMATMASHCIIFWDGSSLGARNMLKIAKEKNLVWKLVKYKDI